MDINAVSTRGAVLLVLAAGSVALGAGLGHTAANRSANRWLALFLFVLAGVAVGYVVDLSRLDREWRWLRHFPVAISLALGPLLFGYIHRLTTGAAPRRAWLHLAPAAGQLIYIVGIFLLPNPWQAVITDGRGHDPLGLVFDIALPVSLIAYALAGLQLLRRYRGWVVQARSDEDVFAARWVRNVLVALAVTAAGVLLIRIALISGRRLDVFDVYPFYVWLLAVGAYLGVEGRRYLDRPFPAITTTAELGDGARDEVSAAKDWADLGAAWQDRTWEAGWWREAGLTLPTLARRLGVNTSYLSHGFNQGLGLNFSEVINDMRAQAVAVRLDQDGPGGDLLDLALEEGFGSKSSFNRAFRRRFGVAPSAYRRRATS